MCSSGDVEVCGREVSVGEFVGEVGVEEVSGREGGGAGCPS